MTGNNNNTGHGWTDINDGYFDYGQWVEFKLNHDVFGIVVGADIHGLVYAVQLAGSGIVQNFHGVTLQAMEEDGEPIDEKEVEVADNVIPVDFTKGVKLTKATRTKGVA